MTPGSEQIRATIDRDGLLADLEAVGATVLANACGPCIGQWSRPESITGRPNTIVNSYNRNFPKRNDGSAKTLSFVTSPDTVMALALAGRLDFDPTTDTLTAPDGTEVTLDAARRGGAPRPRLRPRPGHVHRARPTTAPVSTSRSSPDSDRLQLLDPFPAWDGEDYRDLPVLMKAQGKCTTDHISAAGPWLKYRGHLENISGNLFLGVVNAFSGATGEGKDITDGETRSFPEIAKRYAEEGIRWCAVGDRNYGEGSSREHAAMEPRFRNGVVIFARSFARIHETNAKKQGLVPLTFADPKTYDEIGEDDRINVLGLPPVPGEPVHCQIVKPDGSTVDFEATHTFSPEQVEWFRAGSALNIVRAEGGRRRRLMDVVSTLRTTGAVRSFTDEAVSDVAVHQLLDDARYAPSGGNRQPWRVAIVKNPTIRRRLAELMQPVWDAYVARSSHGVTPFNAVDDVEPGDRRARPEPAARRHRGGPGRPRRRRRPPPHRPHGRRPRPAGAHRRGVDLPVLLEHPALRPPTWVRRGDDDVPVAGRAGRGDPSSACPSTTPWPRRSSSASPSGGRPSCAATRSKRSRPSTASTALSFTP